MKLAPLAAVIGTAALLSLTGMSSATAATHEAAPLAKSASVSPRIIDGSNADFAKVPFAAREFVNGSFNCSASLISPTWVILAKHCVEGNSASSISFKVGSADLNGGTTVKVKRVAQWSQGDVALAELTAPYQGSYATLGGSTPSQGTPGDIYGWGRTAPGAPAAAKLKTASVTIAGTDDQGWSGPSIVETRGSGQAYKGDSGGPLIVNGKLVGVCSGTNSYNDPNDVEYASVPASADWITSTTGVAVT